jgi:hypothetical protein
VFSNFENCVIVDLVRLQSHWHHCTVSNSNIQHKVLSKQFQSTCYILLSLTVSKLEFTVVSTVTVTALSLSLFYT